MQGLFLFMPLWVPMLALALFWSISAWIISNFHFWFVLPFALLAVGFSWSSLVMVYKLTWIEKFENPLPTHALRVNLTHWGLASLLPTTALAWLSYVLSQHGLAPTVENSLPANYDNLMQTYLWHLVDVIPFSNIETTFGLPEPAVRFHGWLAGLPILLFRLYVIFILVATVRAVWKSFSSASESALLTRFGLSGRPPADPAKPEARAQR